MSVAHHGTEDKREEEDIVLILHVVGARPNFMKAAPVIAALQREGVRQVLVHTGQHYDANMSSVFFDQLGIPTPDVNLDVGSGSHAVQTAEVMVRFEKVLLEYRPDWVVVYGDVNSTLAASLVASKLQVPVAHVEAGLRSGDRTMPEELNRLLTDQLASLLFTPSGDGDRNLLKEGIPSSRIRFVGNVMIDTLLRLLPRAEGAWRGLRETLGLEKFALVTLHRPSLVDDPGALAGIMNALERMNHGVQVLFPVHPRTLTRLKDLNYGSGRGGVRLLDPLGYLEFLALQRHATLVITDSGGIQEETTYLGTPCLTVRENTERPVTIEQGTNQLVGHDMERLVYEAEKILEGDVRKGTVPPLWDGHAAERIATALLEASA